MSRPVLLNNVDHADLRVITGHSAGLGDAVNQVLVFPTEYEELQREYPIVFRRGPDGELQSVALLGLDRDENLFLGPGGWEARYIPAVQQRGPLMIGYQHREASGAVRREPMIHIDLDHPRVSRTKGEPLFLPHGGNSPYLEHVATLLRMIHTGREVSKPMFDAFESEGLIRSIAVEIEIGDGDSYVLPDLFTIDEDRLGRLGGPALARLHRGGFLRSAFQVASSLGNVEQLISLKTRRRAAA